VTKELYGCMNLRNFFVMRGGISIF